MALATQPIQPMESIAYDQFRRLLAELFMFDQADLDFGIYRVMNAKREEIAGFLDHDLLPQVREALGALESEKRADILAELQKVTESAVQLGIPPETSPKVQDLRQRLAQTTDLAAVEGEIFSHLYNFFRRYYDTGDFISLRRYKPGVYAIPYEGEEVKLHWATRDQYYIKTSEYLRDYGFSLRPADQKSPLRVHFRLVEATEGEHGNIKPAEGKERVFILAPKDFISAENGELTIRFEYRSAAVADWPVDARDAKSKPPTQKELTNLAVSRVLVVGESTLLPWIAELSKPHLNANGEQLGYSRFEAHLRRYTARNTFDYFIHKDIGGFLRRELDFFIKNEIVHLDDIETQAAGAVERYLAKVKAIRRIASKIIDFLAQLEDFQKKLWLKKKFVVETSYCITLDRISTEFYAEIAANEAQRQEWVRLFAIDEIKGDLAMPAYSEPLTLEFLKANNGLLVDTRFFSSSFLARLRANIENLDEQTDGILVHSDNFQALRLLGRRYREQVKCIYIDPPYNTDSSSIPYKNNYRHSSWATMMYDRLAELHRTMALDAAIFVSIDKAERSILERVMDEVFGNDNRVEELIWSMNTNNSQAPNYSTNHEYVEVYARDRRTAEQDRNMFREPKPGFEEVMGLVNRMNPSYPPISEVETELRSLYERHRIEYRDEVESRGLEWEDEKGNDPWKGLFNYNRAEYRSSSGVLVPEGESKRTASQIWVWQEGDASMPATKQAASTRDPNHPNWRFYKPIHPVTGRECPHPKSGWKFAYDDDADSPDRRSFVSLDRDHRIAWGADENKVPRLKRMLHEVETNVGKSVFQDYSDGEKQTSAMFGKSGVFLAPKHSDFVSRFIVHAAKKDSTIIDCFGGSGSTAHAVIKLNRDDGGRRKYVLAEVGEYFDTVLKPRVLKAAYSKDWRAGKPLSREGISHSVKVIRLESYEDTLNNLELNRTTAQQSLLDAPNTHGLGGLREQYLLRYMLDVEARNSQSLLNTDGFSEPTAYTLRVKRPGGDESREISVDLVETFNYLLGLRVKHIDLITGFNIVEGWNPDDQKVLVIWRKSNDKSADDLNAFFAKQDYGARSKGFDLIYVNGDNTLENQRREDETWRVRLIEEEFKRLMFDTKDV
jgi:adenine-specific DNA-methyltransferase